MTFAITRDNNYYITFHHSYSLSKNSQKQTLVSTNRNSWYNFLFLFLFIKIICDRRKHLCYLKSKAHGEKNTRPYYSKQLLCLLLIWPFFIRNGQAIRYIFCYGKMIGNMSNNAMNYQFGVLSWKNNEANQKVTSKTLIKWNF